MPLSRKPGAKLSKGANSKRQAFMNQTRSRYEKLTEGSAAMKLFLPHYLLEVVLPHLK